MAAIAAGREHMHLLRMRLLDAVFAAVDLTQPVSWTEHRVQLGNTSFVRLLLIL